MATIEPSCRRIEVSYRRVDAAALGNSSCREYSITRIDSIRPHSSHASADGGRRILRSRDRLLRVCAQESGHDAGAAGQRRHCAHLQYPQTTRPGGSGSRTGRASVAAFGDSRHFCRLIRSRTGICTLAHRRSRPNERSAYPPVAPAVPGPESAPPVPGLSSLATASSRHAWVNGSGRANLLRGSSSVPRRHGGSARPSAPAS